MSMTIKTEVDGFKTSMFWAGGLDWYKEFTEEEAKKLFNIISDNYPEGMTDDELNTLFWFEPDTLCSWLGINGGAEYLCTRNEPGALKHTM